MGIEMHAAEVNWQFVPSLQHVDESAWDACLGSDDPFARYGFLAALESTGTVGVGAVGDDAGWQPHHLIGKSADQHIVAFAPCYVKSHGWGEFIFDPMLEHAWNRVQGQDSYYPKMVVAIPFTPVPGARLVVDKTLPEAVRAAILAAMIAQLRQEMRRLHCSSVHCLLPAAESVLEELKTEGFAIRRTVQYHWKNEDFACWDDYLATLTSRRRKGFRKERAQVREGGYEFVARTGTSYSPEEIAFLHQLYTIPFRMRGMPPYMHPHTFQELFRRLGERIVVFAAFHPDFVQNTSDGTRLPVAMALNFVSDSTVYGRHWGAIHNTGGLHFETCYYQAIEYAIATKRASVQAGVQGEHKLLRGYLPTVTYSGHLVDHPELQHAVVQAFDAESDAITEHATALSQFLPQRNALGGA